MSTEKKDSIGENKENAKGTSKEKASFDQNGAGSSDKFGQAGSTHNESGESGLGTKNKNRER
ncbi:hypothetical protein D3C87_892170 [compost metagenome]|uniref:hypothetical protein n=1 Tax=Pedobacter ghigonis TaxID=2730403 RepID=UPI000FBF67D8|nr:hypothetical protein [Pedobacter ghigonis]